MIDISPWPLRVIVWLIPFPSGVSPYQNTMAVRTVKRKHDKSNQLAKPARDELCQLTSAVRCPVSGPVRISGLDQSGQSGSVRLERVGRSHVRARG